MIDINSQQTSRQSFPVVDELKNDDNGTIFRQTANIFLCVFVC